MTVQQLRRTGDLNPSKVPVDDATRPNEQQLARLLVTRLLSRVWQRYRSGLSAPMRSASGWGGSAVSGSTRSPAALISQRRLRTWHREKSGRPRMSSPGSSPTAAPNGLDGTLRRDRAHGLLADRLSGDHCTRPQRGHAGHDVATVGGELFGVADWGGLSECLRVLSHGVSLASAEAVRS